MLSIKNENILRDSGPTNLQTWRAEVPRGSALDQIMEDVLNHAAKQAVAEGKGDELEDELEEAQSEARTMKARAAARATEAQAAEKALAHEKAAHEACRDVAADLRAQLAAAMSLIPHYVAIGDLREAHRSFAADLAELERLRGFEAARLEQDRQQAEDKAAAPEPDPASAEIPEEMFDTHELVTLSPERIEELKRQFPGPGGQIIPIRAPSRSRLDGISRRAHEIADGRVVAPDVRRIADLLAALANAVEPKS